MVNGKDKDERRAEQLRGLERSIHRLMAKGCKFGYVPSDQLAMLAKHAVPLSQKVQVWNGGRVVIPRSVKRLAGMAG